MDAPATPEPDPARRDVTRAAARPAWRGIVAAPMLGVAAFIHLLPLAGLFGRAGLERLYGVRIVDPNLLILLQHRALLFGLLGALLLGAVRVPAWRPLALAAGLASTSGFLIVVVANGSHNASLQRVLQADIVALAALLLATLAVTIDPARRSRLHGGRSPD
jgi:hypothetical protein